MRRLRWTLVVPLAVALTVAGGVALTPPAPPAQPPMTVLAEADPVVRRIERTQQRLRELPGDWHAWAALGTSYVERARVTGDPTFYPRAESALNESLRLRPSNPDALIGLGMLANARHDFSGAARLAGEAVSSNPYSSSGYLVLADAHTQLGDAAEATAAVERALELDPGLPALARAAYDLELRGDVAGAREFWQRARRQAFSRADVSYVHQQLGDLALADGDRDTARAEYVRAGHRYGLAKLDRDLAAYAELAAAQPTPSLLAEYAVLLRESGRDASDVLRLADAALALLAANGGTDDLAVAEVALARGDCASALAAAQRELDRRSHRDVVRMHRRARECAA